MASEWKRDYRMGNPTLALTRRRTNRHILYRVLFLTVPPNFQYQNEKRWAASQRLFHEILFVQKILVGRTTFFFLALKFGQNS